MNISDTQRRALIDQMMALGNLPVAALSAGLSVTAARLLIAKDEDLARELADAEELHKGLLYREAVERATNGKSDALLSKLLEAKVEDFDKDARKARAAQLAKPSSITLRNFGANEKGEVEDVAVKPITPEAQPQSNSAPSYPGRLPSLGYEKGL